MAAFLGMRGTGDWATNEYPESWRQKVAYLYPNGKVPLTAVLGMMKSGGRLTGPVHNWWTEELPVNAGAVTSIYEDTNLATEYSAADDAAAGTTLYAKVAEATADYFRAGNQIVLRNVGDVTDDIVAKVTAVTKNGASSSIAFKTLQDDGDGTNDLSECDRVMLVGDINSEGGQSPDAVMFNPTQYTNYTQIFKTSIELTGTALATAVRTSTAKGKLADERKKAFERHQIKREWARIFGYPTTGTGSNGKPERSMGGILYFLRTYNSDNITDYRLLTDSTYSGKTWVEAGEEFIDNYLETLFTYADDDVLCLCGNAVLSAIGKLSKYGGNIQLKPTDIGYGIKTHTWYSNHGTIHFKVHPLFSYESSMTRSALFLQPKNVKILPLRDTKHMRDKSMDESTFEKLDGIHEEWRTEETMELDFPQTFMFLDGFGSDNEQS